MLLSVSGRKIPSLSSVKFGVSRSAYRIGDGEYDTEDRPNYQ